MPSATTNGDVLGIRGEPNFVYHYTTMESFVSIVESMQIWATSIAFLNDASEFITGVRAMREALDAEFSKRRGRARSALALMMEEVDAPEALTFVASFTELGDDLNQWRSYAPSGGVALGLPRHELSAFWLEEGTMLAQCDYRRHRKWMRSVLCGVLKKPDDALGMEQLDSILLELQFHAAMLKNGAYEAEREWRAVNVPSFSSANPKVEYRAKGGRLLPYVRLALPPADKRAFWSKVKVVLSPGLDELQASAMDSFTSMRFGGKLRVRRSNVPLRSL